MNFTDDHTRWTHIQLLATKDSIFQAYKDFEAWAKLHFKISALQSDRGGEYLGAEFSKYLKLQETTQRLTVHNTPEYNGDRNKIVLHGNTKFSFLLNPVLITAGADYTS